MHSPAEVAFPDFDPRRSLQRGTAVQAYPCSDVDMLEFRLGTQADASLLVAMNQRVIRDEGYRSILTG